MTTASRSLACLAVAREDIRTLLTEPVTAWLTSPKARRTDAQYRELMLIPLDLAAAGWLLQITKTDDEWNLLLAKPVSAHRSIDISAHAISWVHALHQLGMSADGHITSLEAKFRVKDRSIATRAPERITT
jgi:6-phosphogluconolactonase/glucosamine-6-phosphate isomerase/deaminase